MLVGQRIRDLREVKKLSQGDLEHRTGLLRCYTSRVENGHTVPSLETLEKYARALEVPLYHLMYDGDQPPPIPARLRKQRPADNLWGEIGKQRRFLAKFCHALARLNDRDRGLLMAAALRMARGKGQ